MDNDYTLEQVQKIIDDALSEYIQLIYNHVSDNEQAQKRISLIKNYTKHLEKKFYNIEY